MKAFQRVGPQLPEFSYPFIPHGKHPTCLNSSSHHVSRHFIITSFNLPIVPLKCGPRRWSGFCRHSSMTPPVISQHLFSVLSLYDDVLETSLYWSPFSLQVFLSWAGYVWLALWAQGRDRELYIGAIAFLLAGIHFLFYPVEIWNLICNHVIRASSSPPTWDVKKKPVRLVHGNVILNFLVVTVKCWTRLSAYTHTELNDLYPPHSYIFPFVSALLKLPLKTGAVSFVAVCFLRDHAIAPLSLSFGFPPV